MKHQITTILFDVDGVLLDSFDSNLEFYEELFKVAGYTPPTKDFLIKNQHLSIWDTITAVVELDNVDEIRLIMDMADSLEYEPLYKPVLQNDVEEIIQELHSNFTLGVVTSRNKKFIYEEPLTPLEKYFSVTVGFEDVTHHKPHPEPLLFAAKKLEVDQIHCVYIGDMPSDILAAKDAGMQSIYFSNEKHKDAIQNITSFLELPELLKSLDKKK